MKSVKISRQRIEKVSRRNHNRRSSQQNVFSDKQEAEKFRNIFEYAPIGIFYFDQRGIITDCNEVFVKIIGSSKIELMGIEMLKLRAVWVVRAVKVALQGNQSSYEGEYVSETAGKRIFVKTVFSPVWSENGHVIGGTGIVEDITEQMKTKIELRESELRVRKKLQAVTEPEGNLETLSLTDIIDVKQFQRILDTFHEVIGLPIALLNPSGEILAKKGWVELCTDFHRKNPDTLKRCEESDLKKMNQATERKIQFGRCENGLWDAVFPLIIGEKTFGYIFVGQFLYQQEEIDINFFQQQAKTYGFNEYAYMNALKKVPRPSEKEVKNIINLYAELIQMISELGYANVRLARSFEEQKKLKHQMKDALEKADIANEVKEQFLSNMSHELRTPINGLMGMIQLLQSSLIKEEQKEYADYAYQACLSLTAVVNEILNYVKIEKKSEPLVEEVFSIKELVKEVSDLHAVAATQKNIDMKIDDSMDIPLYWKGDRYKIKQILNNLTGNAVKFTKEGFVHLDTYVVEKEGEERKNLVISVKDTGIGIDPSLQESVFQKFSQVDTTSTREYGGTGLGLAISKELAEILGGSIDVKSRPGQGSCFTLKVPLTPAIQKGHKPAGEVEVLINPARSKKRSILIVDDDRIGREVVSRTLKKEKFLVDTAVNGAEAIEKARERSYDLILMDCQMPEIDGYEATRSIRKYEGMKERKTPIIALTAKALPGDREACLKAGMDAYLEKPLNLELLKEWMNKLINR
ncbi:PocR ligand-binding domain-containing protein [Tindallia californiensis]|uniref:Circadian input-output histidine kinase CikA n=1 Tax=Tindallia californiensis TaxID=159292 RepID=A0A1H3KFC3_9FIRM|nr:PocR ligand-binding domain-containing protein [Tindallia californiensis]SDY50843.1 PAS domain S-box-containing protein [Tindallia californiensis]